MSTLAAHYVFTGVSTGGATYRPRGSKGTVREVLDGFAVGLFWRGGILFHGEWGRCLCKWGRCLLVLAWGAIFWDGVCWGFYWGVSIVLRCCLGRVLVCVSSIVSFGVGPSFFPFFGVLVSVYFTLGFAIAGAVGGDRGLPGRWACSLKDFFRCFL